MANGLGTQAARKARRQAERARKGCDILGCQQDALFTGVIDGEPVAVCGLHVQELN